MLFADFEAELGSAVSIRRFSFPNDRALSYAALESWLEGQLPQAQPYVLLGESFSGPLAISLAAKRPPGLKGVILCCSFAQSPMPPARRLAGLVKWMPLPVLPGEFVLFSGFPDAQRRVAFRRALGESTAAILAARLAEVLRVDVRAKLARMSVPLFYLRGKRDWLIPRKEADRIARLHQATTIHDIDAPHMLLQMAPQMAAKAVLRFVGTLNQSN